MATIVTLFQVLPECRCSIPEDYILGFFFQGQPPATVQTDIQEQHSTITFLRLPSHFHVGLYHLDYNPSLSDIPNI